MSEYVQLHSKEQPENVASFRAKGKLTGEGCPSGDVFVQFERGQKEKILWFQNYVGQTAFLIDIMANNVRICNAWQQDDDRVHFTVFRDDKPNMEWTLALDQPAFQPTFSARSVETPQADISRGQKTMRERLKNVPLIGRWM